MVCLNGLLCTLFVVFLMFLLECCGLNLQIPSKFEWKTSNEKNKQTITVNLQNSNAISENIRETTQNTKHTI